MANMSDKVAEISDPTHHTSLMTSLRNFINTESFVDVQFICQGGSKVYAHKLMLISVSGLLKKLLMENPDSNEMITVHLPDINSKLLRLVVNFLYIGYMRLNNSEMDQFKLVLGLLDIELFQKNSEQDSSSRPEVNNEPIPVQNNVYYNSNTPHVAPNVVNATPVSGVQIPNSNVVCYPQNVPTEYVPVMQGQAQHVGNIPVINRAPQYVTVNTDPLATSNGNMVYSTGIPLQTGANGMVVQNSTVQPQQLMAQQNLGYCAYPNNVPGSSGIPSTSIPQTYVVPANMTHLTTHQMPIVSPVPNQSQAQQMVKLVSQPQVQNQPVVNNAVQYSNLQVDTSQSSVLPSPPQSKSKPKRKSSVFIKPTHIFSKQEIIDVSDDESTERIKSTPGPKSKTRRKTSNTVSPGSSSSHPTSGLSTSIKQKKGSKEVIELDNEESRSVNKTTNASL